jgi:hypothetical protein
MVPVVEVMNGVRLVRAAISLAMRSAVSMVAGPTRSGRTMRSAWERGNAPRTLADVPRRGD